MTTTNEPRQLAEILADLLPLLELSASHDHPGRFTCSLGPIDNATAEALRSRIVEALTDPDRRLERIVFGYIGDRIDWEEIDSFPDPEARAGDGDVLLWGRDGIDIAYPSTTRDDLPDTVTHWAPIPLGPHGRPFQADLDYARRLIAEVRNWATIDPGIQIVDLQPDDVLVVKLAPDCTPETARAVADSLQDRFDRPVIVLANGADITAADPADLAPAVPATTRHVLPLGAGGEGVEVEADSAGFLRLTAAELEGHLDAIHAARRSANGRAAIGDEALALLEGGLEIEASAFRLQRGRLLDKARRYGQPAQPVEVDRHALPPDRDGFARTLHYVIDPDGTVAVAAEIFRGEILPALDLGAKVRNLSDLVLDGLDATIHDLYRRRAAGRAATLSRIRSALVDYRDSYTGP